MYEFIFGESKDESKAIQECLFWLPLQEPEIAGRMVELLPAELGLTKDVQHLVTCIDRYYRAKNAEPDAPIWGRLLIALNEVVAKAPQVNFCRAYYLLLVSQKMQHFAEIESLIGILIDRMCETGWRQELQFILVNTLEAERCYESDPGKSYKAFNCALRGYRKVRQHCHLRNDDPRMIGIATQYWTMMNQADRLYPAEVRSEELVISLNDKLWCTTLFPNACKARK